MNPVVRPSEIIVTAAEMREIEARLFSAGMPVAALMEKVGQRITERIVQRFPRATYTTVSILVGPGHNGGDALVVGRELWERGYTVKLHKPLTSSKPLTQSHWNYAEHLGLINSTLFEEWLDTDLIIDGLFGFGLERHIEGELASLLHWINQSFIPVVSIDIPSGIHTDTGETLGTAIVATQTFCLGLWKRALFQEQALNYLGETELIPFGIPQTDQEAILDRGSSLKTILGPNFARILQRSPAAHKYDIGAVLLICGSTTYPGAAILAAQAARATGVGMIYIAVPGSIRDLVIHHVPDAVAIACPETPSGAIAGLPNSLSLKKISAVAIGPGLTTEATSMIHQSLNWTLPLVIDADGLNILAQSNWHLQLDRRQATTVLTPHWGEFKRLFPQVMLSSAAQKGDRITLLSEIPLPSQTTLVVKGAKTLIKGVNLLMNPESTPALARGGSGDVLTGLIAGLLAQNKVSADETTAAAVWWHAQAALMAEQRYTTVGVSPTRLIQTLIPALQNIQNAQKVH